MNTRRSILILSVLGILAGILLLTMRQGDSARLLRKAVFDGNLARIEELLSKRPDIVDIPSGADPFQMPKNSTWAHLWAGLEMRFSSGFRAFERNGCSPLEIAIWRGNRAAVELLLKHGADPNRFGSMRTSAMHQAVSSGHSAIIELFVKHKGNLNVADQVGGTPLAWRARSGDVATAALILDLGADPNAGRPAPVFRAVQKRDLAMVKLLVERGANVNVVDGDKLTPLDRALKNGSEELIAYLRQVGATNAAPLPAGP